MTVFHDKPPQLAMIAGKVIATGNFTDVIGGKMTCGSWDVDGSALITWEPPFLSAPVVFGTVNSGVSGSMSSPAVRFTGLGVSNVYVTLGATTEEGQTIGVVVVGQARL